MSLQNELEKIKQKKFAPVYVLKGTETYLIELFKKEIKKQALEEGEEDFNLIQFDMEETNLSLAIEEAETVPFFGDTKLIFLEKPIFLTSEKAKNDVEHDVNSLNRYLENPSPTTVLVIVAAYEKLDERKKVVKLLKKNATMVDVSSMPEKQVQPYIKAYIENEGFKIDREAFSKFTYLTDMKLSRMMNELNKLFLYCSETKQITLCDVDQLIPKSLEHNIFDLINFVTSNKKNEALTLFYDLLLQGEDAIKINAILISQFRLLLQIKLLQGINYQQSNMVDVLKIHPYRVKLGIEQVRTMKVSTLGAIFDELVENDYNIKTGQMDKNLLFELFLLKER